MCQLVAGIYVKTNIIKTQIKMLTFGIFYILNSILFSDVEVYFFFVESCNFCLKVVWRSIRSHGIHVLLLLIFCISYRLLFVFRIFSGFYFAIGKIIIDADSRFYVRTSCYRHVKWPGTFRATGVNWLNKESYLLTFRNFWNLTKKTYKTYNFYAFLPFLKKFLTA